MSRRASPKFALIGGGDGGFGGDKDGGTGTDPGGPDGGVGPGGNGGFGGFGGFGGGPGDKEDGGFSGPVCAPGQMPCDDHVQCISMTMFCDATPDCTDGSDEMHCGGGGPEECPPGWFMCPDKSCAPNPNLCGGGEPVNCGAEQMACPDAAGQTVCANRCDNVTDCANGMDENPFFCCDYVGGVMCNTSEGDMQCVSGEHVCADDGSQCLNGEDEDPNMCCEKVGGLLCSDGVDEICVSASQVCADDGNQCADGRDEDPRRCCNRETSFFCPQSQECIAQVKRCDGVPDCAGGFDESVDVCGCPNADDTACADGVQCVPRTAWCDGTSSDCNDGADEGPQSCGCPANQVMCPDKSCADDQALCPQK